MIKTVRLAALAVLAFTLTCLCLAGPIGGHRFNRGNCVQRCGSYCESIGMLAHESCSACYCYSPAPVYAGCYGGCGDGEGGCYGGCYGGCDGCGGWGCGGWGGCGGGCGGGGCGGGGC